MGHLVGSAIHGPDARRTVATLSPTEQPRSQAPDLLFALLAGDRVWIDDDRQPPIRVRYAALVESLALTFYVVLLWTVLPDRLRVAEPPAVMWVAAIAGTVAAAALLVRPVVLVRARPASSASMPWRFVWRGVCFLVLVVSIVVLVPGWLLVGAWPLGIIAGSDVMLSTWALGAEPPSRHWWRKFMTSPLHLGVLGALAATLLTNTYADPAWRLVGLYATMHLGILVAGQTVRALSKFASVLDERRETDRRELLEHERRHWAHWLHDDVLSEVRLTTLKVQRGGMSVEQLAHELNELDHRLRLRQIDELLGGGPARLADILQPHLRRAQALGITLTDVPSLDSVGVRVDEATGRLFGRVVAVLTSNAINAGATAIALRVRLSGNVIEVEVTDDAGGFDIHDVPAGRGLDQLMAEIGSHRLRRIPELGGSTMIAHIPVGDLAPDHGIGHQAAGGERWHRPSPPPNDPVEQP
jgi:signal transduction histidine kinase